MKKISFIFLLFIFMFVTGCGTSDEVRTATDLDTFTSVASSYNLSVKDNMAEYSDYDYVTSAKVAETDGIVLQMVVYNDEDAIDSVQENHIESFNLLKATGANITKEKGQNFYKYVMVSNGYYMISSKIDNTLIFCKTVLDNKDTVEGIINQLGY